MALLGTISTRDYSGETTTTTLQVDDTISMPSLQTAAGQLFTDGVILGLPYQTRLSEITPAGVAGAVANNAQRELKWAVTYEDVQEFLDPGTDTVANPGFGKFFTLELGTANPALLSSGTDLLDPSSAAFLSIAGALETTLGIQSPYGGTGAVRQVRLVGRNI